MQPFLADIFPDGWIHGRTVRSRVCGGRLKAVRVPPLPEGYVAVGAQDIPGGDGCSSARPPDAASLPGRPCLARQRVSYIGEPVLLLAGPDAQRLAELAEAVQIEIDEDGPASGFDVEEPAYEERITRGNTAAAFAAARRIVEGEYRVGSLEHLEPEGQGAVAIWEKRAVHVYSAARDPDGLRRHLAHLLKLPASRVRVTDPHPGSDPGEKPDPATMAAAHAALLSRAAGRPVRLVYSREEDLLYTPKSPPTWIRHRTGLDGDGSPVAFEVEIRLDAGAWPERTPQGLRTAALAACGGYRCPNVDVRALLVRSAGPPSGTFRGLGAFQAFFAAELHAARLAEVSGVDPVTWRSRHLLQPGDVLLSGARLKGPAGSLRVLEEAVRLSDFQRRHAAYDLMRQRRSPQAESRRAPRDEGQRFALHAVPKTEPRLAPLEPGPLRGIGLAVCCQPGDRSAAWAATVVDLEVDPVSLQGGCRGIWVIIDAGRVGGLADPPLTRLQVEGAVLQSLGCAALEIGGILRQRPDHYADYGLPGFMDAPPIEVRFLEPRATRGVAPARTGAPRRGLEDLPFLGVFPAYAAAVAQATGCYIDQIPTLPESIQTCLEPD